MKILEINKFNYIKGGADRHFLDVTQLLRAKGHEVAVFAMESPKNEFSPWRKYFVSYVGYGSADTLWQKIKGVGRMFYSFEARRKIHRLLEDFQPEAAHIHNIYHQISPSILSEIKKRRIPIIMTVHDYKLVCPNYSLQCHGRSLENCLELGIADFVRNRCFKDSYLKSFLVYAEFKLHKFWNIYDKNIDLYVSPSEFTREKLIASGIPAEKIVVLPHPIFEKTIDGGKATSEPKNGREKFVLHFGRLSKEKGVDRLLRIFDEIPEVGLKLAGAIEDDLRIPNGGNVAHLGFLAPEKLNELIKDSMFVVSGSRLPETFGLIALESLKNGKPFIGFDTGAFSEIVENDKTGYVCQDETEMKEKIKKLAEDEGLRILFSRNALRRARDFGSEDYLEKLLSLFRARKQLTNPEKNATMPGHE